MSTMVDHIRSMDAQAAQGTSGERLVVFDGICHVCSAGAQWLYRHRIRPPFKLIAMQSDAGRRLLQEHGYDPDNPVTFLVLDAGHVYTQSDAGIHLIAAAGGGWRLIHAARLIPRALRDAFYRWFARNRYRWFGRRTTCYLPPPADAP